MYVPPFVDSDSIFNGALTMKFVTLKQGIWGGGGCASPPLNGMTT